MLSAKVKAAVPTETDVSLDCFVMMTEYHQISLPHSARIRDYHGDLLHAKGIIYNIVCNIYAGTIYRERLVGREAREQAGS